MHGISFESATAVFDNTLSRTYQDYEHGEERYIIYGFSGNVAIMVVHTAKELDDGCLLIRIISARKLNNQERKRYENDI